MDHGSLSLGLQCTWLGQETPAYPHAAYKSSHEAAEAQEPGAPRTPPALLPKQAIPQLGSGPCATCWQGILQLKSVSPNAEHLYLSKSLHSVCLKGRAGE